MRKRSGGDVYQRPHDIGAPNPCDRVRRHVVAEQIVAHDGQEHHAHARLLTMNVPQ